jgi:hypothetical protein
MVMDSITFFLSFWRMSWFENVYLEHNIDILIKLWNNLSFSFLTFFGGEFDSELRFLVWFIETWKGLSSKVRFELSDCQELLLFSLVEVAAAVEPSEVFVEVGCEAEIV